MGFLRFASRRRATARRFGLRARLNAAVLPLVVATMAAFVWVDYQHELAAVTEAVSRAVQPAPSSAAPPRHGSPAAVGRWTLGIHAVHAGVTVALVGVVINLVLSRLVLRPVDRVRQAMDQMARGHWRPKFGAQGDSEIGALVRDCEALGFATDAMVTQLVRAERLGVLAACARQTSTRLEPAVACLGRAASELHRLEGDSARALAHDVSTAAADVLAASRALDRLVDAAIADATRTTVATAGAGQPGTPAARRPK